MTLPSVLVDQPSHRPLRHGQTRAHAATFKAACRVLLTQRQEPDPMRRYILTVGLLASVGVASLLAESWPQWRGPSRDGISTEKGLPTTWSATENVAWRLPLPAFSGIYAHHLGRSRLPERGNRARHRADRAVGHRPHQAGGRLEAAALRRQSHREQAEHVVAVAGHRRPVRVGDERHRDPEGVRLRRQGVVGPRHPEGLRRVRPAVRLCVVSAPAWRRPVPAGFARYEDRRSVVRASHRHDDRQDVWRTERPTDATVESPDSYTTPALLQHGGKTGDRHHGR